MNEREINTGAQSSVGLAKCTSKCRTVRERFMREGFRTTKMAGMSVPEVIESESWAEAKAAHYFNSATTAMQTLSGMTGQ